MMRKMWVWILVTISLVWVNDWYGGCYGCLEEERISLLEIKASFDPFCMDSGVLRDWVDNKEKFGNCCEWPGIQCDESTKRVTQISFTDPNPYEPYCSRGWILNASLFLPFQELQTLDLRRTGLVDCFKNEGFEVLSSTLKKLEVLDLSDNLFYNRPLSLNGLSSLKSLDLSTNGLTESGFEVMSSNLRKLEHLDLSYNEFNDRILSCLSRFSSLKSLNLSGNYLLSGSTDISGKVVNLSHEN
ncbi:unnamed protein product [Dovyalis caffra]|uniref:Leucine-rich repeat-containing N-terminal plant-type domain-containing protein n=1 Tax=Dovyalis caffra TaxID=77055 RepID=A0AAV1RW44_9ROSI|nr:unnamed protein product [Dovyalis caffra]